MTSQEIREIFFAFFKEKQHQIVPSAPMVVKNDPTLMFINAGMNQFKDLFLGNEKPVYARVADTQKCLRVSGKHNDLDEVGHDTYHHTMFEMLGNWSFGDYFKKEAIAWSWELLNKVYGIPADRMYATVFGGDKQDDQPRDEEAFGFWKQWLPEAQILDGSKKDNFWEMGDVGPCGPCSEIHVDLRDDEERKNVAGRDLVNKDHPQVVEIWNLVFIQFQRNANGLLTPLAQKHVDTGMGFERLCMTIQGKKSNYDTDVFQPLILKLAALSNKTYGADEEVDIAMRVVADHLRAIAFSIADGQLPSNVKAGYVIRRILRRAVRYGYTFLGFRKPFMHFLVEVLVQQMGVTFPEIAKQQTLIEKVISEEESSFLRTLEQGISRLTQMIVKLKKEGKKQLAGTEAFELYDTFGFPVDLTDLIARENGLQVDSKGFEHELEKQKARSRKAANQEMGDWVIVSPNATETFVGYDTTVCETTINRYRQIKTKKDSFYQLVLSSTPFYAESGGQVGDSGTLENGEEQLIITDTKKENNLFVHHIEKLPANIEATFIATVDEHKRLKIANNHTATHLLHQALREVLGSHVEQKGSMVDDARLRFDFSHFQGLNEEEIAKVECRVNKLVRENILQDEYRETPIAEAQEMGAMALFGEKYGESVRVIKFEDSIELCGGTHADATGQIGLFKIVSESAIAAGVRRVEAVSGEEAEKIVNGKLHLLEEIRRTFFKSSKDVLKSVQKMQDELNVLQKENEKLKQEKTATLKSDIINGAEEVNGIKLIAVQLDLDAASVKNLAFQIRKEMEHVLFVAAIVNNNKPMLTIAISDDLVAEKQFHAGNMIRVLAKEIGGGGGGQPHFATAGGKNPDGISTALKRAKEFI